MGICKAFYGLKMFEKRWYKRMVVVLKDLDFKMLKIDHGIWMQDSRDNNEYIAAYIDNVATASRVYQGLTRTLESNFIFKIKRVSTIGLHLKMQF